MNCSSAHTPPNPSFPQPSRRNSSAPVARRELLMLGAGIAGIALSACGGVAGTGASSFAGTIEPTAASMKDAAVRALKASGRKQTALITVTAQDAQVLVPQGMFSLVQERVLPLADQDSDRGGLHGLGDLEALPWDRLAQAVGTGEWSGAIAGAGSRILVGGKAKTFLDDQEFTAPQPFLTPETFASTWDQMIGIGGRAVRRVHVDHEHFQITFGRSGKGWTAMLTTAPTDYGLLSVIGVERGVEYDIDTEIEKGLDGAKLTGVITSALKLAKKDWKDLGFVYSTLCSNEGAKVSSAPGLVLAPSNIGVSMAVAALDAKDRKKLAVTSGDGEPDVVGHTAPTSLPGGWKLDDNYTSTSHGRKIVDTSAFTMFSYRKGSAVVSITVITSKGDRDRTEWNKRLSEVKSPRTKGGWTTGTWSGVPIAMHHLADGGTLWANARPANRASASQVLSVSKAFLAATS